MTARILITGGAGFVGHHLCEHLLKNTDYDLIVLDRLSYASNWDRLRDVKVFDERRVKCLAADFTKPINGGLEDEIGHIDVIMHLGAEIHVDNSITNPLSFIEANVIGTHWIHCHDIAVEHDLPKDFNYWQHYNRVMLDTAEKLVVLKQDGWETSVGVQGEIAYAKQLGLPIEYMEPL